MKPIYLIITDFFPSSSSWRCAFAYDYAKAIERDGRYRVVVFKPGMSYEYEGISIFGFRKFVLPSALPCPLLEMLTAYSFMKSFRANGLLVEDVAVAEAYTTGMVANVLALKKRNSKVITVVHHHDAASFGCFEGRFRQLWLVKVIKYFMRRKAYEAVDLHVFISEVVKRSFLSFPNTEWTCYRPYRRIGRGLGWLRYANINDSYVLHNGVDTTVFNNVKRTNESVSSEFVIGCIGNFVDLKDQMTLLRAAAILKVKGLQLKLIFVGSGSLLKACRSYAVANGLQAEFRKEVEHSELADFYRSIDLFVLPSYFEGFGCVFTESWSCGTPFITCEGQGMDDLIPESDRGYWLCSPQNPGDLATKIFNYMKCRRPQRLNGCVDINRLIARFIDFVERKANEKVLGCS